MAANENAAEKRVISPISLQRAIDSAGEMARRSASEGPTGYGAVAIGGDERTYVLRAPHQLDALEGPATIVVQFGDGDIADAIVRGRIAEIELAKSRGK